MSDLSPYLLQRRRPSGENPKVFDATLIEDEERLGLQAYWAVIRRHAWLSAAFFFSVVLTAGYLILTTTPVYTATATLLIEPRAPQVVDVHQALSETLGPSNQDYHKTQYEILQSRSLAAQVIQQYGLANLFSAPNGAREVGWMHAEIGTNAQPGGHQATPLQPNRYSGNTHGIRPGLIGRYQSMLKIQPIARTFLVQLSFSTPEPELSAYVANAHAEVYIHREPQLRAQSKQKALKFLEAKLVELKDRVEQSEAALNRYRRNQGIISLADKENTVVERLADLNKRLTDAEDDRVALEARMHLIRNRDSNSFPAVLGSPLIHGLKGQLSQLESEYVQSAKKYKPAHYRIVEIRARIEQMREQLNNEIQKIVWGIESDYLAAKAKEQELRELMHKQKEDALALKDASVDYAILARESDTNRQLYDSVLQRMKEIKVAAELHAPNATLMDRAEVPGSPSKPNKKMDLLLSLLVGLMGSVGLAFLFEHLDHTFKSPADVKRHLHLPLLGMVPDFSRLPVHEEVPAGSDIREIRAHTRDRVQEPRPKELVLSYHPRSAITETYSKLCTAILLSRAGEAPKTLLFTSGVCGEGKTTNVVNTAILFALTGAKVLLLDADLRNPSCHRVLGMKNQAGLADLLSGHRMLDDVIQPTHIHNLSFMSGGSIPPNPAALVGSQQMYETLFALQTDYDCICLDSPPVMPVSDAMLLSTMVDGVVLLVGGLETPKQVAKDTCARLKDARANILGILLNRVDVKDIDYAYYYYPYGEKDPAPATEG